MKLNNIVRLIIAVAVSEGAGVVGSLFTASSVSDWYVVLAKPALTPPGWVFGPVWIVLYALMGTAAYLIWQKGLKRRDVRIALGIFLSQLILNTLWSIIFFGLQSPGTAFIVIIILWFAVLATIVTFAEVSKPAAWLLIPYILWVTFASYLNYAIWWLN